MKKVVTCLFLMLFAVVFAYSQTTIETKLAVSVNEFKTGGLLKIAIVAKGTNLTAANTIGSATIDITYEKTKITPKLIGTTQNVTAVYNALLPGTAYTRSVTNVSASSYVRLTLAGTNVNGNFDETPAGMDLTALYDTLAIVTFTIVDETQVTDILIRTTSLTIGLFASHNNNDFSGTIVGQTMTAPENIYALPLPVQLTSFTATTNRLSAELKWQTATEVNSDRFDIERREIGGSWQTITTLRAAGTSNVPHEYSYVDKGVVSGRYEYRIKMVDLDGTFKYSSSVEIEVGNMPKELALFNNYPNPFNPETSIEFTIPSDGRVSLKVYNILGEMVTELYNGNWIAGKLNKVKFSSANYPSGIYFARLQFDGKSMLKKMMLIK